MPEPCPLIPGFRERDGKVRRAALVMQVAEAQWSVIAHRQLRDCGISTSAISRAVAAGRLYRRYPGVYMVGHPWLPVEGELTAALLFAGDGAALSHATAAWWWGLIDRQPGVIEISVPGHREPNHGITIHRRRRLHTTHYRRLPITPVPQTLLDYAATAPVTRVRRALAEAEFLGLLDTDELHEACGRGLPGSARLRHALHSHQPELAHTRSALEEAFLALCATAGLPRPEVNVTVCGFLVDAVWREQRVVVELDGLQGHRTPAQLERDHQRDLVLRRNGFQIMRYTWRQITREPNAVLADLRSAYQR